MLNEDMLTETFVDVDNFIAEMPKPSKRTLSEDGQSNRRTRQGYMTFSEMVTIMILFHASDYRTFKHYYIEYVQQRWNKAFPKLLSYNRFVQRMPELLLPATQYLHHRFGSATGVSFIDSTPIRVCKNKRIRRNKVFAGLATTGKSTVGWFHGFKLHLLINHQGEILNARLSGAHVDDRSVVDVLSTNISGKLVGDKGYISSELSEQLHERGLQLITSIRKNMKNKLVDILDKILLRKRSLIETVNGQIKLIEQAEHTRHRSPVNFALNLVAALLAYTLKKDKPSMDSFETLQSSMITVL